MVFKTLHKGKFKDSLRVALFFVGVIWMVHLIQIIFPMNFTRWGILPHTTEGIKGIFFSPFLHSQKKWMHIINNTPTLFFGLLLLFYFYKTVAVRTLLYIYLFTGVLVWAFAGYFMAARYSYHIGASGVVYGLISFIFWSGIFRRNIRSIVLALIMVLMYSGMIVGLLPDAEGEVSWQSHLAGGMVGLILAYQYKDILEPDELQHFEKIEFDDGIERPFLPHDTFDKTRQQREQEQKWRDSDGWIRDDTFR